MDVRKEIAMLKAFGFIKVRGFHWVKTEKAD